MSRAWYSNTVGEFLCSSPNEVLGAMTRNTSFDLTESQRDAWVAQDQLLRQALAGHDGFVLLEFSIPRMGARIDAVVLLGPLVFVLEFKVGARTFHGADADQAMDYALDLHHFHEGSHRAWIAPVLVATQAPSAETRLGPRAKAEFLREVSFANGSGLRQMLVDILDDVNTEPIHAEAWQQSGYKPTPTIVEATLALYRGHSVAEISRSDAGATNLSDTCSTVEEIIADACAHSAKVICFVTGVPGAGKTLVGLNVATRHMDETKDLYSVFLSGNGPLVAVLQEALARDQVRRDRRSGSKVTKKFVRSKVKAFIQNVHHFRDDCLVNTTRAPIEHVAIFDEAQRAWDLPKTADFMRRKKNRPDFNQSESEFLISCLDRHPDWAVVICLIGGGQELNNGEAGISEWVQAVINHFPHWRVFASDRLVDSEYGSGQALNELRDRAKLEVRSNLHLATSIRSFRSERVSQLVKEILDLEHDAARATFEKVSPTYPILLTRNLQRARRWLSERALGSERYGIIVSSQAERLKPHALDVKTPIDPVHWFLDGKDDVRSSYYLEDVATEFHVQGLELDWACVVWDADFRHDGAAWKHWSFRGSAWQRVIKDDRQRFLKNAYRVLLTRARQGMVIVVPEGERNDPTRLPAFYDPTFEYLKSCNLPVLE